MRHGVPFRKAHGIVANLVRTVLDSGRALSQLTSEELGAHSAVLAERERELRALLAPESLLESKISEGGTSLPRLREQLAAALEVLNEGDGSGQ